VSQYASAVTRAGESRLGKREVEAANERLFSTGGLPRALGPEIVFL